MTLKSQKYTSRFIGVDADDKPLYAAGCPGAVTATTAGKQFHGRFLGVDYSGPIYGISECEFPKIGRFVMRFLGVDTADTQPVYGISCCAHGSSNGSSSGSSGSGSGSSGSGSGSGSSGSGSGNSGSGSGSGASGSGSGSGSIGEPFGDCNCTSTPGTGEYDGQLFTTECVRQSDPMVDCGGSCLYQWDASFGTWLRIKDECTNL